MSGEPMASAPSGAASPANATQARAASSSAAGAPNSDGDHVDREPASPTSAGSTPRKFAGLDIPEGMTRSAFKKVVKQRKMEAERADFVEKRREKRRLQRQKVPSRRPKLPKTQQPSGVSVVVDCGFDSLMTVPERTSLASQLTRCYSENRRCKHPVNLTISGFAGRLKERFDGELHKQHELWTKISFEEGDHVPADPSRAVYLTGDAEETLAELEPGTTYYIGGIVDRDRYTNLCLDKAKALGIRAARLPIDEHIKVSGRRVLTTNQAFELLLRWFELRSWKAAFETTIPARKLGPQETAPATTASADSVGAESVGGESSGTESSGAESAGAEPAGAESAGAEPAGAEPAEPSHIKKAGVETASVISAEVANAESLDAAGTGA